MHTANRKKPEKPESLAVAAVAADELRTQIQPKPSRHKLRRRNRRKAQHAQKIAARHAARAAEAERVKQEAEARERRLKKAAERKKKAAEASSVPARPKEIHTPPKPATHKPALRALPSVWGKKEQTLRILGFAEPSPPPIPASPDILEAKADDGALPQCVAVQTVYRKEVILASLSLGDKQATYQTCVQMLSKLPIRTLLVGSASNLADYSVKPEDLDFIVFCTATPTTLYAEINRLYRAIEKALPMRFPDTAFKVIFNQHLPEYASLKILLNLPHCPNIDLTFDLSGKQDDAAVVAALSKRRLTNKSTAVECLMDDESSVKYMHWQVGNPAQRDWVRTTRPDLEDLAFALMDRCRAQRDSVDCAEGVALAIRLDTLLSTEQQDPELMQSAYILVSRYGVRYPHEIQKLLVDHRVISRFFPASSLPYLHAKGAQPIQNAMQYQQAIMSRGSRCGRSEFMLFYLLATFTRPLYCRAIIMAQVNTCLLAFTKDEPDLRVLMDIYQATNTDIPAGVVTAKQRNLYALGREYYGMLYHCLTPPPPSPAVSGSFVVMGTAAYPTQLTSSKLHL